MADLPNNTQYFKPLTGVRAIAAFMVYFHHYNPVPESLKGSFINDFIKEFHVGVTLFFVLSGFLIAYRYLDLKQFSFRNYMVNRIARIYPIYFFITTLTFVSYIVVAHSQNIQNLILYGLNISFLRGFFDDYKFSGIAQGWSLTVEETFYLLAPLFFLFIKRNKWALLGLPVLLFLAGTSMVVFFSRYSFHGFFSSMDFMTVYTFFGRGTEFFIGIALAVIYKNGISHTKFKLYTYLGLLGMIASIGLMAFIKGDYDFGIMTPFGKLINNLILPLFGISFFFYGLLTEQTLLSKILGSKVFLVLGKSSYIFYLIHMGVIADLVRLQTSNYILLFVVINVISIGLFHFVEEPLNKYLRTRFSSGKIIPVN